jgi:farnesol dehydrogenase
MKYFLTGATGFIGAELAKILLSEGHTIHALVRSPERAKNIEHPNLKLFKGDVTNLADVEESMAGCDYAFHLAGYAKPWSKDKNVPYEINVKSTEVILEASLKCGIKRLVFTSTAGTLKPSDTDELIDENSPVPASYLTDYEQTKRQAELRCFDYVAKGLDVVIVNPTRVYGPGLLSKSNSVTTIINQYSKGKWHILPGNGNDIGNYVFVSDVVEGHLLALKNGRSGERYILGGENSSFANFFTILSQVTGKSHKLYNLPLGAMMLASRGMMLSNSLFGTEPLITPQWVKRYYQNRVISSDKAVAMLGYKITPLAEGMKKTLDWLNQQNQKL